MVDRLELLGFCSELLQPDLFRDAALNGLQVEGTRTIHRLLAAVSVSERTIQAAVDWQADALVVHHGLIWGDRIGAVVGPVRQRLRLLLENEINLIGFHLPLDAHPTIGNNALLASKLGLRVREPFAEVQGRQIGVIAEWTPATPVAEIANRVALVTGRRPTVLEGGPADVSTIAILSGSGSSALDEAVERGCQVLVTGDVREPTMALAREMGITVVAGGHEATERLGIEALAAELGRRFGVETRFISDPNPI